MEICFTRHLIFQIKVSLFAKILIVNNRQSLLPWKTVVFTLNVSRDVIALNGLALEIYRPIKGIFREPMIVQGLRKMVTKFQAADLLFLLLVGERNLLLRKPRKLLHYQRSKQQWKAHMIRAAYILSRVKWPHQGIRCTKLSVKCCNSNITKSKMSRNFNVTILL